MAVPYSFGSATSAIPLSQLDSNFATVITLGNTAIQLGNTVTTLNNMTLVNATISSGNVTVTNANVTSITATSDSYISGLTVGKGAGAVSTNTAVGASALAANTTGADNTALGINTLVGNIGGSRNTALGRSALNSNTSGTDNISVGYIALYSNTTGASNTGLGTQALYSNTTASNNTAIGYQALYASNRTADTNGFNTAIGWTAGSGLTTGQVNTFLGAGAGNAITSGSKNSIIGNYNGNQGGLDIRTLSNYIVLSDGDGNPRGVCNGSGTWSFGTVASAPGSGAVNLAPINSVCLGTTGTTGYYAGAFYNGSTLVGSIVVNAATTSFNVTSDQRLKENIQDSESASDLIDFIQVRKFDWKVDGSHQRYGFIAQELVSVAPEAVHQPEDTEKMMAVDYSKLVPMLVKEIQSLRKRVAQLESN